MNTLLKTRQGTVLAGLCLLLAAQTVRADGPGDGQIVRGNGSISTSGSTTTITQQSQNMVLYWDRFNIAVGESVIFRQPNSNAAALNRIFDQNPSRILGTLSANGRILLINPYGIVFGENANVNVGSLFATTLELDPDDFMRGAWNFQAAADGPGGVIVNHGLIRAADGGSVNLFGSAVRNTGLIIADYGQVNLAAGRTATVDFDGDGMIRFAVDGDVRENLAGLDSAVSNSGTIRAAGGQVLMTAHTAQDVFAEAVNNSGVIEAGGVERRNGRVYLVGQGGDVVNTGRIDVSNTTGTGGEIRLLSDADVRIGATAELDADGVRGGGEILIGGDYQGGNPEIINAQNTTIESGARISADAEENGDGGRIIVWSDGTTRVHGEISARGGSRGGDGGFVEVSGAEHLWLSEIVDLRAPSGEAGMLWLDPGTITVCDDAQAGCTPDNSTDIFSDAFISTQLGSANLTLDTNGATNGGTEDILFQDATISISWASANDLILNAGRNITLTGTINGSDPGSAFTLNFGQDGVGGVLDLGDAVITAGTVTAAGGAGSDTIQGQAAGHTWNITAADTGNIDGLISFSAVENLAGAGGVDIFNLGADLTGGAAGGGGADIFNVNVSLTGGLSGGGNDDLFDLADGVSIAGGLDGGAGSDTVDWADYSTAVSVSLTGAGSTDGFAGGDGSTAFDNIDALAASTVAGGTLTGMDADADWSVSGADDGSYISTNSLTFTDFGNLTGGTGADTFIFGDASTLSGTLDGGGGSDTLDLSAYTTTVTFNLSAAGGIDGADGTTAGTPNPIAGGFANIDVFQGGTAADTFNVTAAVTANLFGGAGADVFDLGAVLTGTLDGEAGSDTLQGTQIVDVTLTGSDADGFAGSNAGVSGGFAGIDVLTGTGTGTLTGENVAATWTLDGTPTYDETAADGFGVLGFSGFADLQGGTAADIFGITAASSFNLFGGAGADVFNLAADLTGNIDGEADGDTFNAQGGTATGVTGGSTGADSDTVVGSGAIAISAADQITANGQLFTDIENVTGSAGDDSFTIASGATLSGVIDGGEGSETAGDELIQTDGNNSWTISGADAGDVTGIGSFANIENLTGGTAADSFTVGSAATLTGIINGGAGSDSLIQTDGINTWDITGANAGDVTDIGSFTAIENLTGGTANDTFVFSGGSVTGTVDGGAGGTDTLDYSAVAGPVSVNLATGAASLTGGFANIDGLTGSAGSDTLTGANDANSWTISGAGDGAVDGFSFAGIENLTGGSGDDAFVFGAAGSLAGLIDGGAQATGDSIDYSALAGITVDLGADIANIESLTGSGAGFTLSGGNNWTIDAADGGTVDGIAFSGFANLTGTAGNDTFTFLNDGATTSGSLSGTLDGLSGSDELDVAGVSAAPVTVDLVGASVSGGTGIAAFANLENLTGGGAGFTLSGGSTWSITGANDGTVDAFSFTDFANLTGTTGADSFTLNGGSLSGSIDGVGGSDTLQADNVANIWNLTAIGTGNVTGVNAFTGIENLTGGTANDAFVFSGGSVTGTVDGGAGGTDTLDYSAVAGPVSVNLATGAASLTGGFANIDGLTGSAGSDTLVGADDANTWNLTGTDAGNVDGFSFSGVENLTGGSATDSFAFSDGAGLTGAIDGGAGSDTLNWNAYTTGRGVSLSGTGSVDGFAGSETSIAGGFDNIDVLTGSGTAGDSLTGLDAAASWDVDGANTYTSTNTLAFGAFETLIGGSLADVFSIGGTQGVSLQGAGGNDRFVFADGAGVTGSVAGGAGTDELDYAAYTTAVTANLATATATGTGGFSGIESLVGGSANDTLTGANNANTWTIDATDGGDVDGFAFSGVENLTGGSATDTFLVLHDGVTTFGALTGTLDGAGGADGLDIAGVSLEAQTVDLATTQVAGATLTAVADFASLESFTGDGGAGAGQHVLAGGSVYTITGADDGTADGSGFTDFSNLQGTAGTDSFTFADGGSIGSLDGLGGSDTLDVAAVTAAVTVNLAGSVSGGVTAGSFAGIENVTGDGVNDTLAGANASQTWDITGAGDGSVGGIAFTDFAHLAGGTLDDVFRFNGGSIAGDISGGAGNDSLDYGLLAGPVSVNLQTATASNLGGTFAGIESLVGSAGSDTLTGLNAGSTWNLTGADSGTVGGFAFSGVENLTGGTADDAFVFGASGSLSGVIDGGAHSGGDSVDYSALGAVTVDLADLVNIEQLLASNAALTGGSVWVITGTDSGTVDGIGFSGFADLTGTTGADSFTLSGGSVSGTIDGLAGSDTLTGNNTATTWTLTGTNAGSATDVNAFTGIENLTGGSAADTFNLGFAVTGTVTGGAGNDVFDYTAGVSIGTLTGGAGTDTLIGDDVANTWTLTVANGGTLNTQAFTAMENLTGGTANDAFVFGGGSVTGTVDGGAGGTDTLDYSAVAGPVSVNLATGAASLTGGFANIDGLTGSAGSDTLTGANNANTWTVSAADAGDVDGFAFSGVENLVGGSGVDTFNMSAGVSGLLDGSGGTDTVAFQSSFTAPAATLNLTAEIFDNSANATVTATSLVINGATSFGTAANPILTNIGSLTLNATGNAYLTEADALSLTGVTVGGDFALLSGGTITQTGAVSVGGMASLDAGGADIILTNASNDFGTVLLSGGNVSVRDVDTLAIGNSTVTGNLQLRAGGNLTDTGVLNVSGNTAFVSDGGSIVLDAGHVLGGTVSFDAAGNATLINQAGIVQLAASQVGGNLTISATGDITDTGPLAVTGASVFTSGGGDVLLDAANDFNSVSVAQAANVLLNDMNSLTLNGVTASGDLDVVTGNALTVTGALATGGAMTFDNGGLLTVGADLAADGGFAQTGPGSVNLAADIATQGTGIGFGSPVSVSGSVNLDSAGGDIAFGAAVTGGAGTTLDLDAGGGQIALRDVGGLGVLNLAAGQLQLDGDISVGSLGNALDGAAIVLAGDSSITVAQGNLDFSNTAGIDALTAGAAALSLTAQNGSVRSGTVGDAAALRAFTVSATSARIDTVTTTGNQTYTAATLDLAGNLVSSGGSIVFNGASRLLRNITIGNTGGTVRFNGSLDGASVLDVTAGAALFGDVGQGTALEQLLVNAADIRTGAVTTSGHQRYTGDLTVGGNLTGGSLIFDGAVDVINRLVMRSDTIDFNGGPGSVSGNAELTLVPMTDGATVGLGGSGNVLNLNTTALDGYDAGLVIGGLVNGFDVTPIAGDIEVNSGIDVGTGYLILVGSNIVLNAGTLVGETLTLIAADPAGQILNEGGDDTLLLAELIILVAGNEVGTTGDINAQAPSGMGILEIASGSPVAFIVNVANSLQFFSSPNTAFADLYAQALGLPTQSSNITNAALGSAGREQTGELEDDEYIDPSLFEDISLYEVFGTGILLPRDQRESEEDEEDAQTRN